MRREVEQIFFLLGRWRKSFEIFGVDNHMASRAGHDPFARALQRLPRRPSDVEQALTRFCIHFFVEATVRPKKPHQGHASSFS